MAIDLASAWRAIAFLMLGWLALFFGLTLRAGREPLITRIARLSEPQLPAAMARYTRRLTAIWCGYFVVMAVLCLVFGRAAPWLGALAWIGTAVLFIGEPRWRPRLLPGHRFPGLRQQLQDTLRVWRPRRPDGK
jgi:uncharacterized membrane protein